MKILIVDDEKIIRNGIVNGCDWAAEGFDEVLTASDGEEALEVAKNKKPEIILTDIRMPKISGLELTEKLAEQSPKVKIIIMSGYGEFEYAKTAIKYGVSDYLLKPAKIENILKAVHKAKDIIEEEQTKTARIEELETQFTQNTPIMINKYLNDLLNDVIMDEEQVLEGLEIFDITFPTSNFVVCVFNVDCLENLSAWHGMRDYELLKYGVINILSEMVNDKFVGRVFEDNLHQIVMLVNFSEDISDVEAKRRVVEFSEECRKSIFNHLETATTIGIGRYCTNYIQLKTSYQEAITAVRYKLLVGKNRTVHIDDLRHIKKTTYYYPKSIEEEIVRAIETGDTDSLQSSLKNFFRIFRESNINSTLRVKNSCIGMLFVVSRKLSELQIYSRDEIIADEEKSNKIVENAETIDEIEEGVTAFLNATVEKVIERCHISSRGVISVAKQYIKDNITGDTTLKKVSDIVHMSPNYFTYLFKRETGENFSNYVTNYKIEKAKVLLKNKDMKTYEVAEMTGFLDSRYFSQFFKRYTGVTPSTYRQENNGGEQDEE